MLASMDDIKALRDRTGVSVMECKKALEEAGGDIEKALVILRKKSGRIAEKKQDRTLGAGTVAAYIHSTKEVGAMIVLSSETDFVSKHEDFIKLAYDIAMHVAATAPTFISRADVTEESTRAARSVFLDEAKDKGADMQEKIVEGKMDAYLKERVLLEQPYIKNPDVTIQGLIEEAVQKFGEKISVTKCVRFAVRE